MFYTAVHMYKVHPLYLLQLSHNNFFYTQLWIAIKVPSQGELFVCFTKIFRTMETWSLEQEGEGGSMNKEPSEDHNFLAHVCYFLSPWHNPKIIGESKDKLIMEFWILGSLIEALTFHNLSVDLNCKMSLSKLQLFV